MDILHHDLKAIKASCFRNCTSLMKFTARFSFYDSIAGSKECEYMRNEMTLSIVEGGPIFGVSTQINLFGRPETGFVLFILFPKLWGN
jgi:hypothetical protein